MVHGIGGGIKQKYHWIKWVRDGPKEGPPKEEKVIQVIFFIVNTFLPILQLTVMKTQVLKDGCRSADIALVCTDNEMKYILATENMKAGDIIKTSTHIPRIPGNI